MRNAGALRYVLPRRQGEQGRGEALLFGGLAHVFLLVLLPQWPLWLRLILAGLLWLLVWCLYFSGRVWQGLLAICGFWAAAAALDAGIFAAFQSLCGSGAAARLLSDPDAVYSCLSGPRGGKSGVFFRAAACRFRSALRGFHMQMRRLRIGRKRWMLGQFLYIALASLLFFAFLWTAMLTRCLPVLRLTGSWGPV